MSRFDFEGYVERRSHFTEDEWIDVLIRSIARPLAAGAARQAVSADAPW